jgi:hypothetical protein
MAVSSLDISNIVRPDFIQQQGPQASRKYKAYTSTYGLRVAMGMVEPDEIQELNASRQQINNTTDIPIIASSNVSDIMDGSEIEGVRVAIDYDRAEQQGSYFPWTDIQSLLDNPDTVYDVPIQRLVIRFDEEDFTEAWKDKIESAVDDPNFPISWVEPPFFAILESAAPDSDARQKVKNDHEERYFLPKSNTSSNGQPGLGWTPRVLDLHSVWSHKGWAERSDTQLEGWSNRQSGGNWTPKRIEQRLMNFFEPEEQYTGMLRDDDLMNRWRDVISRGNQHDYTSYKTFEWEDEEEWILQE